MTRELKNYRIVKMSDTEIINRYKSDNGNIWGYYLCPGLYKIFEYSDIEVDKLFEMLMINKDDCPESLGESVYKWTDILLGYALLTPLCNYTYYDHDAHKTSMTVVNSEEYFNGKSIGDKLGEYYSNKFYILDEYYDDVKNIKSNTSFEDMFKLLCESVVTNFPIGKLTKEKHTVYERI